MNKKIKKIAAAVMAAATLAAGSVGMTASAQTVNDNYSTFTWSKSGSNVSVSLTNNSGASRYATISAYGYTAAGAYVDNIGKSGTISQSSTISKSGSIVAASYRFFGYLYSNTTGTGGTLSYWSKSIG